MVVSKLFSAIARRTSPPATDLSNADYRNEVFKNTAIGVRAGCDEFYYDWAIGGTGEVMNLFNEIREIAKGKGRNLIC